MTSALLAQGPIGILCTILLGVAITLYRDLRSTQAKNEATMQAERERHASEIAAERNLNAQLQNARISEMREGLKAVEAALTTMDTATKAYETAIQIAHNRSVK